ncbi:putative phage tail protein [Yersinia pekkanenii]|uniref:Putative phage tail protein n=1 Tax=Yersinia pekkanenii TaxID=1288385 RepID=A0A0T9PTE4_9GAMM|nr:hypothetical protein [Yersinia pekkanenii]CNH80951.1 putative phage tail protein [Yersinia pekkanenii]
MDIFTGSNTYLMYCDDLTNTSPKNTNFTQLNNLATFPSFQQTSEVKRIETYDSEYSNVQLGSMNLEPITITLNYVLDNVVLDQYYNNNTEFQLMLCMENSNDVLNYIILNGQITSTQIDGDKDSTVTKTYTFEPTDIQARGSVANTELYRSDYGVGSNGVEYPHNTTSTGNGFFLLDKNASNNSLGVDLIGTQTINNGKTSQMLITDTGTNPIFRLRSNNGDLVKVYTTIEKPSLLELGAISAQELNTAIDDTKTYVSTNYYNKTQADIITNELKLYSDTNFSTKTSVAIDIAELKLYSDTTFPTKVNVGADIAELKLYSDSTFSTKVDTTTDIETLKTYTDSTFSTKVNVSTDIAELKLYSDSTFSTKVNVSTDIAELKLYSDNSFSTKTELSTKLNLSGGTLTGPLVSKQSGAITFTPMDNTAYNWIHWTQFDGTAGWRMGRLENNGPFYLRDYSPNGVTALRLEQGQFILTSNTAADTPWINATLQNGWTVTANRRCVYRKILGMIYIEVGIESGTVGAGNVSTPAFTLPVGYRPQTQVIVPISGNLPAITVGTVLPRAYVALDGSVSILNVPANSAITFCLFMSVQ